MEITTENYHVYYNTAKQTVFFQGSLRLSSVTEYTPIVDLLNQIVEQEISPITLDLQELQFLNSSGINILSKFVIQVRNLKNIQLIIVGTDTIPWQSKSLKNLQRLMPSLQLKFS